MGISDEQKRRQSECNGSDPEKRMGGDQGHSEGTEDAGCPGIIFRDSPRQDRPCFGSDKFDRNYGSRQEVIGGILRQLKRLQASHLAYVKAHEERLKSRLEENQEHQQQLAIELQELEKVIIELLDAE